MTIVRALRAPALRILFALALLSAQHVALAHGIWHLGDHSTQPSQKQLCDQHEALNTVAGSVDCPMAPAAVDAPRDFLRCFVALPAAATPGLASSSRGPPTRS